MHGHSIRDRHTNVTPQRGVRIRALGRVLGLSVLLLVLLSGTAAAQPVAGGEQVVVSGDVHIAEGQEVGDVVVLHGSATVDGTVRGSVIVFDGPLTVNGTVSQDVVAFNGPVRVTDGARVSGDLVTPRTPQVSPGATVEGEVLRANMRWGFDNAGILAGVVAWTAVSASTLALGLLLVAFAPRVVDATVDAVRHATAQSLGWGFAVAVGLPIVAVLALLTIVGIPFGIGVLLALALLYAVGYVATGWIVGGLILRRRDSAMLAFLLGWVLLRIAALVPVVGALVWFPGAVVGLGALVVAARGRRPLVSPAAATPPTAPIGA